ncbi:MAG: ACT domain-containing protein [Oscillospiraceae bacterium]|nr:ACT domain-containing protein [Oscillospiraceae bacterium]
MELKVLPQKFTVCKVSSLSSLDLGCELFFVAKTDEELSVVCPSDYMPENVTVMDDGWRGFRIQGVLDFSLIGILAKLSGVLAESAIGIFAVSTYNTDYILVKEENLDLALSALRGAGYSVV